MAGRYLDQQIPFIGINNAAAMQKIVGVARSDFRFKLFKNNYLTAMANYALTCNEISDFKDVSAKVSGYFGGGVQYTYNSIIGPVGLNVHWSEYTHNLGLYFSLGFDF